MDGKGVRPSGGNEDDIRQSSEVCVCVCVLGVGGGESFWVRSGSQVQSVLGRFSGSTGRR